MTVGSIPRAFVSLATMAALSCASVASAATPSAAVPVTVDPAHTSASFSVKHLTLTTITGTIPITAATIALGENNVITAASATLDLSRIDTHETDRDNDLRSAHWFNVAQYPTMTFKSTKIDAATDGAMTIAGDLTFLGITKPVTLAAKFEGSVKDGKGRTHLGYSATGTIDRSQWGLGANYPEVVVGNTITINLELEAITTT